MILILEVPPEAGNHAHRLAMASFGNPILEISESFVRRTREKPERVSSIARVSACVTSSVKSEACDGLPTSSPPVLMHSFQAAICRTTVIEFTPPTVFNRPTFQFPMQGQEAAAGIRALEAVAIAA